MSSHRIWLKGTALIVCMTMFVTSFESRAIASLTLEIPTLNFPAIPHEMGDVTAEVMAPNSKGTFIHIQSAHGHVEAESNIEKILAHLTSRTDTDLVLLEGAANKLQPELFRNLAKDEKGERKALNHLLETGYLTGPETFLVNSKKSRGLGIEDVEAYKANRRAFIQVYHSGEMIAKGIDALRLALEKAAAAKLSKDLKSFLAREQDHADELMTLEGWLNFLADSAKKNLAIDLTDAQHQLKWPGLVRYVRLKKLSTTLNLKQAEIEKADFFKALEPAPTPGKSERVDLSELKALLAKPEAELLYASNALIKINGATHPYSSMRLALDHLFEKLPESFSFSKWPAFKAYLQHIVLMQELGDAKFQDEIEKLAQEIKTALIKTETDQRIANDYTDYRLLKKALSLELTRDEYEIVVAKKISPESLLKELLSVSVTPVSFSMDKISASAGMTGEKLGVRSTTSEIEKLARSIRGRVQFIRAYGAALEFYKHALTREDWMIDKAIQRMRSEKEKRAFIVTGGFHAEGIKQAVIKQGYSYVQVMPRISQIQKDAHDIYVKSVLGSDKSTMSGVLPSDPLTFIEVMGFSPTAVQRGLPPATGAESNAPRESLVRLHPAQSGIFFGVLKPAFLSLAMGFLAVGCTIVQPKVSQNVSTPIVYDGPVLPQWQIRKDGKVWSEVNPYTGAIFLGFSSGEPNRAATPAFSVVPLHQGHPKDARLLEEGKSGDIIYYHQILDPKTGELKDRFYVVSSRAELRVVSGKTDDGRRFIEANGSRFYFDRTYGDLKGIPESIYNTVEIAQGLNDWNAITGVAPNLKFNSTAKGIALTSGEITVEITLSPTVHADLANMLQLFIDALVGQAIAEKDEAGLQTVQIKGQSLALQNSTANGALIETRDISLIATDLKNLLSKSESALEIKHEGGKIIFTRGSIRVRVPFSKDASTTAISLADALNRFVLTRSETRWTNPNAKKILVVGTGFVGATKAILQAIDFGHDVVALDVVEEKLDKLRAGELPFEAEHLPGLLRQAIDSGRLTFTSDYASALKDREFVYLALPTPQSDNGQANTSYLEAAVRTIAENLKPSEEKILIGKSTAPPKWTVDALRRVANEVLERRMKAGEHLNVNQIQFAWEPEFLREAKEVEDDRGVAGRIVIGGETLDIAKRVADLYAVWDPDLSPPRKNVPIILTDLVSAPLVKYAANGYRGLKISYINFLSWLTEELGFDINEIADSIGLDPRVIRNFLTAGPGFGGSCFPKDLAAFVKITKELGVSSGIILDALAVNRVQIDRMIKKMGENLDGFKGKKIVLLGGAFKAGTSDTRESRAVIVAKKLVEAGAHVVIVDPAAKDELEKVFHEYNKGENKPVTFYKSVDGNYDAIFRDSSAIAVMTEWPEFKNISFNQIRSLYTHDKKLPSFFDGRNLFERVSMERLGFEYFDIGRGRKPSGMDDEDYRQRKADFVDWSREFFLVLRISYINMIAEVAEKLGANILDVQKGFGYDPVVYGYKSSEDGRIAYLDPGIGWGGHDLVDALQQIEKMAGQFVPGLLADFHHARSKLLKKFGIQPVTGAKDEDVPFVGVSRDINHHQIQLHVEKIKRILGTESLNGKKVSILGVAYKQGTHSIEASPSVELIEALLKEGAVVHIWDPEAAATASVQEFLQEQGIHGTVKSFGDLHDAMRDTDLQVVVHLNNGHERNVGHFIADGSGNIVATNILDARHVFKTPERFERLGVPYHSIGLLKTTPRSELRSESRISPPSSIFLSLFAEDEHLISWLNGVFAEVKDSHFAAPTLENSRWQGLRTKILTDPFFADPLNFSGQELNELAYAIYQHRVSLGDSAVSSSSQQDGDWYLARAIFHEIQLKMIAKTFEATNLAQAVAATEDPKLDFVVWLRGIKEQLEIESDKILRGDASAKEVTFVLSHAKPDFDAVVSSIAKAYLLQQQNPHALVIPLLHESVSYAESEHPILHALRHLKGARGETLGHTNLLTLDEIRENSGIWNHLEQTGQDESSNERSKFQVVLVDHHEKNLEENDLAAWTVLRPFITEVEDHHLQPVYLENAPVEQTLPRFKKRLASTMGSTATLIAQEFRDSNISIPPALRLLMLLDVVIDSENLQSNSVRELDRDVMRDFVEVLQVQGVFSESAVAEARLFLEAYLSQVVLNHYAVKPDKLFLDQVKWGAGRRIRFGSSDFLRRSQGDAYLKSVLSLMNSYQPKMDGPTASGVSFHPDFLIQRLSIWKDGETWLAIRAMGDNPSQAVQDLVNYLQQNVRIPNRSGDGSSALSDSVISMQMQADGSMVLKIKRIVQRKELMPWVEKYSSSRAEMRVLTEEEANADIARAEVRSEMRGGPNAQRTPQGDDGFGLVGWLVDILVGLGALIAGLVENWTQPTSSGPAEDSMTQFFYGLIKLGVAAAAIMAGGYIFIATTFFWSGISLAGAAAFALGIMMAKGLRQLSFESNFPSVAGRLNIMDYDYAIQELAEHVKEDILITTGSSFALIPNFADPIDVSKLPDGFYAGVDIGGTNFRVRVIEIKKGVLATRFLTEKITIPDAVKTATSTEAFFDFYANAMREALESDAAKTILPELDGKEIPLGFTFSFEVDQTAIDEGHTTKAEISKGFVLPDLFKSQKNVVEEFQKALERRVNGKLGSNTLATNFKVKVLLNDTTATGLAGSGAVFGLILGTGFNLAAYLPERLVAKIFKARAKNPAHARAMFINLEAGNSGKNGWVQDYLTPADKVVDEKSENKGDHLFEKMISGAYLGKIVAAEMGLRLKARGQKVPKEIENLEIISEQLGQFFEAEDKVKFIFEKWGLTVDQSGMLEVDLLIREVLSRAAGLVVGVQVGVLQAIDPKLEQNHKVAVDGSLYAKSPVFREALEKHLLRALGDKASRIQFELIEDASSLGAAIGAASASRAEMRSRFRSQWKPYQIKAVGWAGLGLVVLGIGISLVSINQPGSQALMLVSAGALFLTGAVFIYGSIASLFGKHSSGGSVSQRQDGQPAAQTLAGPASRRVTTPRATAHGVSAQASQNLENIFIAMVNQAIIAVVDQRDERHARALWELSAKASNASDRVTSIRKALKDQFADSDNPEVVQSLSKDLPAVLEKILNPKVLNRQDVIAAVERLNSRGLTHVDPAKDIVIPANVLAVARVQNIFYFLILKADPAGNKFFTQAFDSAQGLVQSPVLLSINSLPNFKVVLQGFAGRSEFRAKLKALRAFFNDLIERLRRDKQADKNEYEALVAFLALYPESKLGFMVDRQVKGRITVESPNFVSGQWLSELREKNGLGFVVESLAAKHVQSSTGVHITMNSPAIWRHARAIKQFSYAPRSELHAVVAPAVATVGVDSQLLFSNPWFYALVGVVVLAVGLFIRWWKNKSKNYDVVIADFEKAADAAGRVLLKYHGGGHSDLYFIKDRLLSEALRISAVAGNPKQFGLQVLLASSDGLTMVPVNENPVVVDAQYFKGISYDESGGWTLLFHGQRRDPLIHVLTTLMDAQNRLAGKGQHRIEIVVNGDIRLKFRWQSPSRETRAETRALELPAQLLTTLRSEQHAPVMRPTALPPYVAMGRTAEQVMDGIFSATVMFARDVASQILPFVRAPVPRFFANVRQAMAPSVLYRRLVVDLRTKMPLTGDERNYLPLVELALQDPKADVVLGFVGTKMSVQFIQDFERFALSRLKLSKMPKNFKIRVLANFEVFESELGKVMGQEGLLTAFVVDNKETLLGKQHIIPHRGGLLRVEGSDKDALVQTTSSLAAAQALLQELPVEVGVGFLDHKRLSGFAVLKAELMNYIRAAYTFASAA